MFPKIVKKYTYQKKSKPVLEGGFTLIETIVAIIILLAVISFAFTISYNNTKYADLAKDQVVATFLVQDAFDYVIAHKKQNIIGDDDEPADWLDGFGDCLGDADSDGCSIDTSSALESAIIDCGGGCDELKQTAVDDIYGHIGDNTKFTRKVTIDEINSEIEAVVTVVISWKSGFLTRDFSMSTNIFNTRY